MGAAAFVVETGQLWARVARSAPAGLRRLAGALSATLAGQALLLCGLFLITRISVTVFAPVGFGEYQVARRTLAVVALPLLCGLGISMPRYIARDIADKAAVGKWIFSSAVLAAGLICLLLVLGTRLSGEIGRLVFGRSSRDTLTFALLLAVSGMSSGTLAVAGMRGLSRFRIAAALQVINGALVPLAGVALCGGRVERAFHIAGTLWIVIALAVFVALGREWAPPSVSLQEIGRGIGKLFIYGIPRVPGDVALFGLFALPAYAAVHRNNIVGAGFVSVGLSLVQAIATVFASAGFVLLPYWSRAARTAEGLGVAKRRIGLLLAASVVMATLGMILLQLVFHPVVHLLLGSLASAGDHNIRYILFGAVPYVVYLVLRDYFDAISVFPMNTVALSAAIGIQAVLLSTRHLSIPAATAISFFMLGLLMTVLWLVSLRRFSGKQSG
jgi:O-antigen/teichoic acid export membrane protein